MQLHKLKKLKCWILYRLELCGNRMKKIPVNPKDGKAISVSESEYWTDYDTAMAAQQKINANGVGVVFNEAPIEGKLHLTGIDIDHCLDAAANSATPVALEIGKNLNSYTEVSPSGTGLHILVLSAVSASYKNQEYGIEIYSRKRFFTFTGNRIPSLNPDICDRTVQLEEIIVKYFPNRNPCHKSKKTNPPTCGLFGCATSEEDNKILAKMFKSRNGEKLKNLFYGDIKAFHNDHSRADFALACHLSYWTNNNLPQIERLFRKSGLMRPKWDSLRGSSTYGQLTVQKAIEANKHKI